jgi:hypothetical protein
MSQHLVVAVGGGEGMERLEAEAGYLQVDVISDLLLDSTCDEGQ